MPSLNTLDLYATIRVLAPSNIRHLLDRRVDAFKTLWRLVNRQRNGRRSRVWIYIPRMKTFNTTVLAAHWAAANFFLVVHHCHIASEPNPRRFEMTRLLTYYNEYTGQVTTRTARCLYRYYG